MTLAGENSCTRATAHEHGSGRSPILCTKCIISRPLPATAHASQQRKIANYVSLPARSRKHVVAKHAPGGLVGAKLHHDVSAEDKMNTARQRRRFLQTLLRVWLLRYILHALLFGRMVLRAAANVLYVPLRLTEWVQLIRKGDIFLVEWLVRGDLGIGGGRGKKKESGPHWESLNQRPKLPRQKMCRSG